MSNEEAHIPDSELLEAMDGETSTERMRTMKGFIRAHQVTTPQVPGLAAARAELQASLRAKPRQTFRGNLAYASAAAVIFEDYLHMQVCSGKLDLQTAQHDIAGNWIAAYRKYFNTDHPLEQHAAFSVDPPWEE